MRDTVPPIQSQERLRNQAIDALVPFLVDGPSGDMTSARLAANELLDDYQAATPKELQLSAEIIAYSWATMACLRTAIAAKNLLIDDVLRTQGNAIALDQSGQKVARALEARRKERATDAKAMRPENVRWDEGGFQLAINRALEKLIDANAKMADYMPTAVPVASVAPLEQKAKLPNR